MKRIVSAILIIFTLLFCLTSCGPRFIPLPKMGYPEGYTSGFYHLDDRSENERWWIETYDELVDAMDLLKSHGSTFQKMVISDYEGDLFDVKYCISISRIAEGTELVKFGDNPFDRKATGVIVWSYAFFDDITIDELNYSYVINYDVMKIQPRSRLIENGPDFSLDSPRWEKPEIAEEYMLFDDNDNYILQAERSRNNNYIEIPDEVLDALADSLVFIGFE